MKKSAIRVGGASGFWGDAGTATQQLLASGINYLAYDYLAEVTLSIMARARAADGAKGYATDFVSAAMAPSLAAIAAQNVKVVANAGGMNPRACADALRREIAKQGLQLRVGVVLGDDLFAQADAFADKGFCDMFSGAPFPPVDKVVSINAYLGAFPIAAALNAGADIVVTGRCVDSAVTLAACIHAFGWTETDFDLLAAGSLAGHILECGTQATGGNFTDWELVADTLVDAGYPIAEIQADGTFACTKAADTGGLVSVGTIAEQLLYEIGDPQAYMLPDVACDFSGVMIEQFGPDRVLVRGAAGRHPGNNYKVSATFEDGYRGGEQWIIYGRSAARKAKITADSALERARRALHRANMPDFTEVSMEVIGPGAHYGETDPAVREVLLKLAVKHIDARGVQTLFKEFVGAGLSAPPGLTAFGGGRPRPTPVVRLFSFLAAKTEAQIEVEVEGQAVDLPAPLKAETAAPAPQLGVPETPVDQPCIAVPLERLAWARSGDKGDKSNIGVIARRAEFLPYIWAALTPERVSERFAHFLRGGVDRYYLPGLPAMNLLLHDVLGGGGIASLRADPQGKGYAQVLLEEPIMIPAALIEDK